jgi:hypothetical protein
LVQAWLKGFERLLAMAAPEIYPAEAWSCLIDDADHFLKRWADQAARLGWQSWETWGVHRHAPWRRIGAMGLVPSLQGRKFFAFVPPHSYVLCQTRSSQLVRSHLDETSCALAGSCRGEGGI